VVKIYDSNGHSYVIRTNKKHLNYISHHLRKSDAEEIYAAYGMMPIDAVDFAFNHAKVCYTWIHIDKPIAIFGVNSHTVIAKSGSPWIVGTNDVNKLFSTLYRHTEKFLNLMFNDYEMLENYVDCRNKASIRWLKWCGFNFDPPEPFGFEGKLFMRFWRVK